MRFAFKIALRFLKSGRGQTVLIILGISIGVSVQVFIGSLIQGLQKSLINTTIGSSSQITIKSENKDGTIKDWKRAEYEAGISDKRIRNISAAADGSALVEHDGRNEPVVVRGFNINDADKIYNLKSRTLTGRLPLKNDEVIIGIDLDKTLKKQISDTLYVIKPSGEAVKLIVTGIYDLGTQAVNKSWLITNMQTAQDIFGYDNKVTSIEMQVTEPFKADAISSEVAYTLSDKELSVTDWKAQNASLLSGLNGQNSSSYIIQVFVILAVLLGISSVLAISVVQRSRQLGILKAMGIKDRTASQIFLFQGAMLGISGAVLGISLGIGLMFMFEKLVLNPDGTPVVPVYFNISFIGISGVFAILSAMLAAIIPARLSSRLNPIEVIKNG